MNFWRRLFGQGPAPTAKPPNAPLTEELRKTIYSETCMTAAERELMQAGMKQDMHLDAPDGLTFLSQLASGGLQGVKENLDQRATVVEKAIASRIIEKFQISEEQYQAIKNEGKQKSWTLGPSPGDLHEESSTAEVSLNWYFLSTGPGSGMEVFKQLRDQEAFVSVSYYDTKREPSGVEGCTPFKGFVANQAAGPDRPLEDLKKASAMLGFAGPPEHVLLIRSSAPGGAIVKQFAKILNDKIVRFGGFPIACCVYTDDAIAADLLLGLYQKRA